MIHLIAYKLVGRCPKIYQIDNTTIEMTFQLDSGRGVTLKWLFSTRTPCRF
jgi:hypothetical protein